jgi:hypothetical protein
MTQERVQPIHGTSSRSLANGGRRSRKLDGLSIDRSSRRFAPS